MWDYQMFEEFWEVSSQSVLMSSRTCRNILIRRRLHWSFSSWWWSLWFHLIDFLRFNFKLYDDRNSALRRRKKLQKHQNEGWNMDIKPCNHSLRHMHESIPELYKTGGIYNPERECYTTTTQRVSARFSDCKWNQETKNVKLSSETSKPSPFTKYTYLCNTCST